MYGTNGENLKEDGWSAVTSRARKWKEAPGEQSKEEMDWVRRFLHFQLPLRC